MKRILLRGSWQTKNIGDIAHTPGFLRLAADHLPDTEMWLWPCVIDCGVREMLLANFPSLRIVENDSEIREAFDKCDLLVHGSSPMIDIQGVNQWRHFSDKPYGFYGITADGLWSDEKKDVLSHAAFIFCRDSLSKYFLGQQNLECLIIRFTPDSTFALRLQQNEHAEQYMAENGLEKGKFICMIPRLRRTPNAFDEEHFYYRSPQIETENNVWLESDMEKMRQVICAVVEKSDLKVLICPEMTYQVPLGRRYLYERLPESVRKRVVLKREYWITDEAQSLYAMAHSLVSMEMHSPIIFITTGRPAILLRQAQDTWKGQMWRDINLQDWIFELNSTPAVAIEKRLFEIINDYPAALRQAENACRFASETSAASIKQIAQFFNK